MNDVTRRSCTTYDQIRMMELFLQEGPFAVHMSIEVPTGFEDWERLEGIVHDYPGYAPVVIRMEDWTPHPYSFTEDGLEVTNLAPIVFPVVPRGTPPFPLRGFLIFDRERRLRRFMNLVEGTMLVTPAWHPTITRGRLRLYQS